MHAMKDGRLPADAAGVPNLGKRPDGPDPFNKVQGDMQRIKSKIKRIADDAMSSSSACPTLISYAVRSGLFHLLHASTCAASLRAYMCAEVTGKSMKKNAAGMGMMGGNVNSLFKRPEKSWRPAAILLLYEVTNAAFVLCRVDGCCVESGA
jgi:hypothetical protein